MGLPAAGTATLKQFAMFIAAVYVSMIVIREFNEWRARSAA